MRVEAGGIQFARLIDYDVAGLHCANYVLRESSSVEQNLSCQMATNGLTHGFHRVPPK